VLQPANRVLQKLNVSTNNLTEACIEDIEDAMVKNTTLRSITAGDNAISEKGLKKIDKLLRENIRKAELERAVITVQVDGASTKVLAYHSTKVLGEHQKG